MSGRCGVFDCEFAKGILNLGRSLLLGVSLTSRVVVIMGSFSEKTSVVVKVGGEEANGLSVRSGMVLVVDQL